MVYLSVPHGLGIDRSAVPVVARLVAHLTRGLMPVEVDGDVEWMVNRTTRGWAITLINPAGQDKPQQGMTPTDYRQNRPVTIQSHVPIKAARDLLLADEPLAVENNRVRLPGPGRRRADHRNGVNPPSSNSARQRLRTALREGYFCEAISVAP